MKKSFLLNTIIVLFFLASCSAQPSPPIGFDQNYLNQQIELIQVNRLSSFDTQNPITILLNYNTENQIVFADNYNLRLFIQENNGWEEISEKTMQRFPEGDILLSTDDPSSYRRMVTFIPNLPDKKKAYSLRVYIFGNMEFGKDTKTVAAFVDLQMSP